MQQKPVQDKTGKRDNTHSPLPRSIKTLKDARRLLARLISEFRAGRIDSKEARTLTYMLTSFVQLYQQSDLEERLNAIEDRMDNEKH